MSVVAGEPMLAQTNTSGFSHGPLTGTRICKGSGTFARLDPDTLLYEFTVEDPTTWTQPWTAQIPMKRTDAPLYEYACHEGNYGMTNLLQGARADDKALATATTGGTR